MNLDTFYQKTLEYCYKNKIKEYNLKSINEFIIENKLKILDAGAECLVFVNENYSTVYKIYDIFRIFYVNQHLNRDTIILVERIEILNDIFKNFFKQDLNSYIRINDMFYLIYTQKYVKKSCTLHENIIINKQLNELFNTTLFNINSFNIISKKCFSWLTSFNYKQYKISDLHMKNITLDNNKLFFYDLAINYA